MGVLDVNDDCVIEHPSTDDCKREFVGDQFRAW
jgi:hypothetical protein